MLSTLHVVSTKVDLRYPISQCSAQTDYDRSMQQGVQVRIVYRIGSALQHSGRCGGIGVRTAINEIREENEYWVP